MIHRLLQSSLLFLISALPLRAADICTVSTPECNFLKPKFSAGLAAGNSGDYYQNADNLHANVSMEGDHPQVQVLPVIRGYVFSAYPGKVVVGNASLAHTTLPGSVSLVRHNAMNGQGGAMATYNQYRDNDLFWYPEHTDHDEADDYSGMLPTVNNSQGSSGSEMDEVRKMFYTLAAFQPATKTLLVSQGLLMPTVQMIMRRTRVASDAEYLTGKAHVNAFDNKDNGLAMVQMANGIAANQIPPFSAVRMIEDTYSDTPGRDFFDSLPTQRLYDTPVSIARLWRGFGYTKRMRVTGADSVDANGRALTYHWKVLRGDPAHVRITPLNAQQSDVQIDIDYHAEAPFTDPINSAVTRNSNLVVIGLFVHNGFYYSAPAFITSYTFPNEKRLYDTASGRLLQITYEDRIPSQGITLDKSWQKDIFHYATNGVRQGWTRYQDSTITQFTSEGHKVVSKDSSGRVLQVIAAVYQFPSGGGYVKQGWTTTGSAFAYTGNSVLPEPPPIGAPPPVPPPPPPPPPDPTTPPSLDPLLPGPLAQAGSGSDRLLIRVFPNPWRGDRHSARGVTFENVPAGGRIQIFTVSGHAVRELRSDGTPVEWNRRNSSGDLIASGLYVYVATDAQGRQFRGKMAIIK